MIWTKLRLNVLITSTQPQGSMSYDYESYNDPISGGGNLEFSDKSIRHGFIRKVYLILCGQLTITFGLVALFTLSEGVKAFARNNQWLFWVALVTTFVCLIALSCCGNLRRKFPHNFIFLGLFTVCEGFLLGCASASFEAVEILIAVGITAAVVLGLTLFAFQTKFVMRLFVDCYRIDFTMCGGFVLVSVIVLMLFGILALIFRNRTRLSIYVNLFVIYFRSCPLYIRVSAHLLFCFYLVFDTQMMLGGNHRNAISPEEYVFAALTLYLDIINIFMYILTLIGYSRD
ncbi:Protein lifeguard 1 [Armadillidium vulgare]|nr:Protein lifeguard 1 [Armadillidium vulgare]